MLLVVYAKIQSLLLIYLFSMETSKEISNEKPTNLWTESCHPYQVKTIYNNYKKYQMFINLLNNNDFLSLKRTML